jgi:hypothetical protein
MTNHIISFLIGLTLSAIYIYFKYHHGAKGKIRKFIRENRLLTETNDKVVPIEWLRQMFLTKYPDYRGKVSTETFLENAKSLLLYKSRCEELEDGGFYINKNSPLLTPPPATKQVEPFPEGFNEF